MIACLFRKRILRAITIPYKSIKPSLSVSLFRADELFVEFGEVSVDLGLQNESELADWLRGKRVMY